MQKIIKDMESKGIKLDSADHKAIENYFQQNPKALETFKKANEADVAAQAGKTQGQLDDQFKAQIDKAKKRDAKKSAAAAPAAPTVAAKL
jgi:hypothetical protein